MGLSLWGLGGVYGLYGVWGVSMGSGGVSVCSLGLYRATGIPKEFCVGQPHSWQPGIENPYRGLVVWVVPESLQVVVTLYRVRHECPCTDPLARVLLHESAPCAPCIGCVPSHKPRPPCTNTAPCTTCVLSHVPSHASFLCPLHESAHAHPLAQGISPCTSPLAYVPLHESHPLARALFHCACPLAHMPPCTPLTPVPPQDPHATVYDPKEWTFVVENVSAPV